MRLNTEEECGRTRLEEELDSRSKAERDPNDRNDGLKDDSMRLKG